MDLFLKYHFWHHSYSVIWWQFKSGWSRFYIRCWFTLLSNEWPT